jgi:hypothetical protein
LSPLGAGQTPLLLTADRGYTQIAELLLAHGGRSHADHQTVLGSSEGWTIGLLLARGRASRLEEAPLRKTAADNNARGAGNGAVAAEIGQLLHR